MSENKNDPIEFECDCGFKWLQGKSGHHQCGAYYMEKVDGLKQELDAMTAHCAELKKENDAHHKLRKHLCSTCGGAGFVGNAPDDYYDCPECLDRNNKHDIKVKAQTVRDLISEKAVSASIDGVSQWIIYKDDAEQYVNELETNG